MGVKTKQFTINQSIFSARVYRTFTLGLFSFLIAFIVASTFAPVQISDAAQIFSATYDATGYYVNVSGSSSINIDVIGVPDGQLVGAKDTITTTTNSPRGYQLYISASPNYLYLNGDVATSSQGKFSPIGGSMTNPIALGNNTWGFALNSASIGVTENSFASASAYATDDNYTYPSSSATYTSVPATDTMIQSYDSNNLATNGTNLDIFFGLKANTLLESGTYSTNIIYTAISDGVNNNNEFMQDFTTEQCQALPIATTENYDTAHIELMDSRDLKWYTVARMKDGNCWMTSNLALDGGITLTPDDSNVAQNRTIPATANLPEGSTEASVYDSPQIYTAVQDNTTTDCGEYAHCVISDIKYGNLYNWNAATATVGKQATTGTVYESVCPKGWRLPDDTGNKSISGLLAAYNLPSENGNSTSHQAAIEAAQKTPLLFSLGGEYYNKAAVQGRDGDYWSRTVYSSDTNHALYLNFYTNHFNYFWPHGHVVKSYGFSVRCVFQGSEIEDNMFMQDINFTMCHNLTESTATSDNRRAVIDGRNGKSYNIAHLADGNCWMVDNLSIYNQTITSANSDFDSPTIYTIPAGITATSEWSSNIYNAKRVEVPHGLGGNATKDTNYYTANNPKVGVFYNWTVAVAKETTEGLTTAPNTSICPKGWTLPTNGDKGVNKSWAKLLDTYGITTGAQLLANSTLGFSLYYGYWNWNFASELAQGSQGRFWSGTPSSEPNAYHLYYYSGSVIPQDSNYKGYGFSIRCLLR